MTRFLRLRPTFGTRLTAITAVLFLLGSCMTDFDKINTDPNNPFTSDLNKDNLWGGYIQSMQQTLFPEDDNAYQRMDELHANIYSGYHGEAAYWNGHNSTTFSFGPSPGWHNVGFQVSYGSVVNPKYPVPGIMNSWNQIRQRVDSTSVVFAAGEIIKVAGMQRATDMYGPIPYTQYGSRLYPEYDAQELIYKTFFHELDHAIKILSDYAIASPSARPLAKFDILFGSDIRKWVQFANSLKLRLAIRIRFVEPDLARQYANQAVSHPFGVIEDNAGNALVGKTSIYTYVNPITMLWQGYKETKMGAPMDAYMNGYEDPRLEKYFSPASGAFAGQYKGARYGASNATGYALCSTPRFTEDDAIPFMTAAEVYFLRAEGATLPGWEMNGSAGELYNKGIQMSMAQWEISGATATDYMNNSALRPIAYADPTNNGNIAAQSTITIQWNEQAGAKEKLERIITQKWIAMYPNGQEAWSEYRRTGYPKLFPPVTNHNASQVQDGIIRRIPLPATEQQNNKSIYEKAIRDHFGGSAVNDNPGTRLWWNVETIK